jgi:methionyl-tRNA formyltransferase
MRFIYPLDMEIPYGRIMLNILIERGLIPEIVIEEDSPGAEHHRNLFKDRLKGRCKAPSIASQVEKHGIRYEKVSDLNGPESREIISSAKPDLTVLGGTRNIIKKYIFSIPPWGTLCSHPGLLPEVRGAASPAWSIYHDIKVGCSCVIIDEGIDTGPVIKTKLVPVYQGDTYPEIVERNILFCGELMAEVVAMFKDKDGPIQGESQDLTMGKTYPTMPPDLVPEVIAKLENGSYRWFEPKP